MKKIKKINRRIISAALVVFMVISNFMFFSMTGFAADPPITVSKITMPSNNTIQAGNTFESKVTVKNNTDKPENISVSTTNTSRGVISVTTRDKVDVTVNSKSETTISFYFDVDSNATYNVYEITFTVKYISGYETIDILDEDDNIIGTEKIAVYDEINETKRITVNPAPTAPTTPVQQPPRFEKVSEVYPQSVPIGKSFRIGIKFANTGGTANNITVSITYPDGVEPQSQTKFSINRMTSGQTSDCVFDFKVTDKAEAKLGNFEITVSADSAFAAFPIGIMFTKDPAVEEAKKNPEINIISAQLPGSIKKGEIFEIKAVIKNVGEADVKSENNLKVSIEYENGITELSLLSVPVNSLKQNEQTEVIFKARADESIAAKYYSIKINADYKITDKDGNLNPADTKVKYAGLNVLDDKKDDDKEKISDVSINAKIPGTVKSGEDFKISVTVKNNGGTEKNIYLKVEAPAGITDKNASSVKGILIPELKSGASITKEFTFRATDAVAGSKCYFDISLTTATDIFTQYAETTVAALPPSKEPKIVIDSIKLPYSLNIGDTFNVDVTVSNTGAADAENVILNITAPNGILNKTANTIKIDSLRSGSKTTKTFTFIVTQSAGYGYNAFNLEASYLSQSSETGGDKISQYFGVMVNSSDLRIQSVTVPNSVGTNSDFNVEVAIKNTGADTSDITLSLLPQGLLIGKTNNTVIIDSIKAGETIIKTFTFMATEASPNGYVAIDITLTHGEDLIKQYTGTIVRNPPKSDDNKPDEKNEIPVVIINWSNFVNVVSDKPDNNNNNNSNGDTDLGYDNGFDNNFGGDTGYMPIIPRDGGSVEDDAVLDKFINNSVVYAMPMTEGPAVSVEPGYSSPDYGGNYYGGNNSGSSNITSSSPVVDSNAVYGGKTFIFTIELLNTHRSVAAKDLKITISQDHGIFNPKSGSNTFFIERLEPGETAEISIELLVKSDADPDSYGLNISMSYKSESGEPTSSSEIINIPVQQEMRFSVGDLPPINPIEMGDDAYINLQFGNLGKSWIYNAIVRVQGDGFMNMEGTYYAGNIEKGKFLSKEFTLTPFMAGYLSGSFVFTYEDADGNVYSEECPFDFMVMGGEEPTWEDPSWDGDGGGDQPVIGPEGESEDKKGLWLFTDMNFAKWAIIIGGGLFIVAVIVGVVVAVVLKKKKSGDDDDDL